MCRAQVPAPLGKGQGHAKSCVRSVILNRQKEIKKKNLVEMSTTLRRCAECMFKLIEMKVTLTHYALCVKLCVQIVSPKWDEGNVAKYYPYSENMQSACFSLFPL